MAAEAPAAAEAESIGPRIPLVAARWKAAGPCAPKLGKYAFADRRWERDGRPASVVTNPKLFRALRDYVLLLFRFQ